MNKWEKSSINQLISHNGWKTLKRELNKKIEELTDLIVNSENNEIKAKAKRDAFIYLLELPEYIIEEDIEEIYL